MGNVGSLKELPGSSGALAHQRRHDGHGRHGPDRVGRQKGQIATPRRHGNGRGQGRGAVPRKAVQNSVEQDGTVLFLWGRGIHDIDLDRGRTERFGLHHDGRRRFLLLLLPLARLLDAHDTNQHERQADGDLRHVRGRRKGRPDGRIALEGIFERKGAHAQQRRRQTVAHAPQRPHPTGLVPALSAAARQEGRQVVGACVCVRAYAWCVLL